MSAACILGSASERFSQLATQDMWLKCKQALDFQQAMWMGSWQVARQCALQLAAFDPWHSKLQ